jgi:hypothetical protein
VLSRGRDSFRVLAEMPLVVMLLYQTYKTGVMSLVQELATVMMQALGFHPSKADAITHPAKFLEHIGCQVCSSPCLSVCRSVGLSVGRSDCSLCLSPARRSCADFPLSPCSPWLAGQDADVSDFLLAGHEQRGRCIQDGRLRLYSSDAAHATSECRCGALQLSILFHILAPVVHAACRAGPCMCVYVQARKEVLVTTRHILGTEFRRSFVNDIDLFLDERVLVGDGKGDHPHLHPHSSSSDSLRPLAFSTLADLIHHVRQELTLPQLSKTVHIFSRNVHDSSLPIHVQVRHCNTVLLSASFAVLALARCTFVHTA